MKNLQKGSTTATILVIVITLLILGGGYYLYKQNKSQSESQISLDLSSAHAMQFRTVLTEAFKKQANFDRHYVIAEIGCGSGCFSYTAIDKNTGKVFPLSTINDIGQYYGSIGQAYSLQSNQIKVIADNGSKLNTYRFQ